METESCKCVMPGQEKTDRGTSVVLVGEQSRKQTGQIGIVWLWWVMNS